MFGVDCCEVGVFAVKQRLSDEVASKVIALGVKSRLDALFRKTEAQGRAAS